MSAIRYCGGLRIRITYIGMLGIIGGEYRCRIVATGERNPLPLIVRIDSVYVHGLNASGRYDEAAWRALDNAAEQGWPVGVYASVNDEDEYIIRRKPQAPAEPMYAMKEEPDRLFVVPVLITVKAKDYKSAHEKVDAHMSGHDTCESGGHSIKQIGGVRYNIPLPEEHDRDDGSFGHWLYENLGPVCNLSAQGACTSWCVPM